MGRTDACLVALAIIVISVVAGAQEPRATIANPHFYEIRKDGRVSWILGSMHAGIEFDEVAEYIEGPLKQATLVAG